MDSVNTTFPVPEHGSIAATMLSEMNCDPDDFAPVAGRALHQYMVEGQAWAHPDAGILIFMDIDEEKAQKFLYYMGAEKEAQLSAAWLPDVFTGRIVIYAEIDASRLQGSVDETKRLLDTGDLETEE